MDPMDRTEWLDGLKPGDEVAFQLSPNAEVLIDQVRKRTPTGQIVLGCGRRFTAEGLDSGEIVAKVAEEAGVSPGLVEFILGR